MDTALTCVTSSVHQKGSQMLISAASPQALIDWFHIKQESQKIMCVMLAPASEDQKKLEALTLNLYQADAVMGREVAFILLHPGVAGTVGLEFDLGEVAAFTGIAFPSEEARSAHRGDLAYPLRHTPSFRDLSDESDRSRADIAGETSRAMARFVPDFMNIFEVKPSELPCLCLVVKGIDESIVLSLKPNWTSDQLIELLGKIRRIVDATPDYRSGVSTLAGLIPKPIEQLREVMREIEAKQNNIAATFDKVLQRHSGTGDDARMVASFVSQGCSGRTNLERVLDHLSIKSSAKFAQDGQTSKLIRMVENLDQLRAPLIQLQRDESFLPSVAEYAKRLVESREELFAQLQGLSDARKVSTSQSNLRILAKLKAVMEYANTSGDFIDKAGNLIAYITKLIGKGG